MTKTKRYELVEEDGITIAVGRTVKRIRALVAIAELGLSAGDTGGYVENENNLSQDGSAWVSGNAQVYGNARVSGDAQVHGSAWVSGDAQVSGSAWVSGDAQVSGNAQVYGNARVSGSARVSCDGLIFWVSKVGSENGTLTVYACKDGSLEVTRGCFCGSVSKFLEASAAKHNERTRREYELLIEVAKSRIEAAKAAHKEITEVH